MKRIGLADPAAGGWATMATIRPQDIGAAQAEARQPRDHRAPGPGCPSEADTRSGSRKASLGRPLKLILVRP